jgi:hypothetical protein
MVNNQQPPNDEKRKNDEEQVEWSFDFANLGASFNRLMDSLAGEEDLKISEYEIDKADTETARVQVQFSVGKGSLSAVAEDSYNLFEATIRHVGQLEYEIDGEREKQITLRQQTKVEPNLAPVRQGLRALANRDDLSWDVKVARDVPLSLDVDAGIGPITLDLNHMTVRNLDVDGGVGKLDIHLPQQTNKLNAEIDGGVGQVNVSVPENADMVLNIDGGVGGIDLTIAPGTALQIRAEGGIGSINVPEELQRMTRRELLDAGGVWQSEGFDLAERTVVVRYDGGVGALNVRYGTTV